jgi:hypothetical protein
VRVEVLELAEDDRRRLEAFERADRGEVDLAISALAAIRPPSARLTRERSKRCGESTTTSPGSTSSGPTRSAATVSA